LTKFQAESLNIPIIYVKTKGEKEKELDELKQAVRKLKVDAIITGAVASNYQRERIEKICKELKIKHLSPLWGRNQEELVNEMVDSGMEIIITAVAADGLTKEWLGRKIDKKTVLELKKLNLNIAGEGGEFESFVLYMPGFGKRLKITEKKICWKQDSGYMEIKLEFA
jgi:ABC transporter with metal-binding/Fe-S-binding domain ATP-binding protein